jgi:hypothetical protein
MEAPQIANGANRRKEAFALRRRIGWEKRQQIIKADVADCVCALMQRKLSR